MRRIQQEGLDLAWQVSHVGPEPEVGTDRNQRNLVRLVQPGYESYTHFELDSCQQDDVVLSCVQTGVIKFVGEVRSETDQESWRCGWLQTIRRAERSALYDNKRALLFRIGSTPVRDVEDDSSWPFTCASTPLTRGLHKLESSDAPIHYVPTLYPGSDGSELTSSTGCFDFLTVLACYQEKNRRLIVLGGYQWSVDFTGTYRRDWSQRIRWTPAGKGFSVRQVAHNPAAVATVRHRSNRDENRQYDDLRPPLYSLWGAEKMSVSLKGAADHMEESFDGKRWSEHRDHTTEEDKSDKSVAWKPSSTAIDKAQKSRLKIDLTRETRGLMGIRPNNNDVKK